MNDYLVTWEINVTADSPRAAAELAREAQVAPGTWATVFDVFDDDGNLTNIDLMEGHK
jgi:hypothetical protein